MSGWLHTLVLYIDSISATRTLSSGRTLVGIRILGCEACSPEDAELPFDNVLDPVTGNDPAVTDYILETPAKCPQCKREIAEKTLLDVSE